MKSEESIRKNLNHRKEMGFTLLEMLIVISIIAILATFSVINLSNNSEKSNLLMTQKLLIDYASYLNVIISNNQNLPETLPIIGSASMSNGVIFNSNKSYIISYQKKNKIYQLQAKSQKTATDKSKRCFLLKLYSNGYQEAFNSQNESINGCWG